MPRFDLQPVTLLPLATYASGPARWPPKSASSIDDYAFGLSAWLAGANIVSATVEADSTVGTIRLVSVAIAGADCTLRVAGGEPGKTYPIEWSVQTDDGRQRDMRTLLPIAPDVPLVPLVVSPNYEVSTSSAFVLTVRGGQYLTVRGGQRLLVA